MPGQVWGKGYPVQPRFSGVPRFWRPAGEEYTAPLPAAANTATGRPGSNHLFYAVNNGRWWMLWCAIGGGEDATLRSAWSTDLLTWTPGDTTTLTLGLDSGYNLAVAYKSISSTDVVHIGYAKRVTATLHRSYDLRATISGTTITFGASVEVPTAASGDDSGNLFPSGLSVCFDSTNKIFHASSYIDASLGVGDSNVNVSTNADLGTSWSSGFGTPTLIQSVTSLVKSAAYFDLGAAAVLGMYDDGSAATTCTDIRWSKFTGTWSTAAAVFGSSSTQDANDWGACARTTTDVHAVRRTGTNTYQHARFNGTTWSAGQAIPTQNNTAGTGVLLVSDDVDVWLLVIDSDAAMTVRSCKWSSGSSTWGTWAAFESSTQVRSALSGSRDDDPATGQIGICWTEVVGAGFQVVTKPLVPPSVTLAVAGTAASTSTATGALTALGALAGVAASTTSASGAVGVIPPTLVTVVQVTDWQTTSTPKLLPSLTWLTGDVIVVIGSGAASTTTLDTPTVAGLTFTPLGSANTTASSCWVHRWAATAASGGSGTISVNRSGPVAAWGAAAWQYRGSDGIGVSPLSVGVNTKTVPVVETADNSAVIVLLADFGAGATAGAEWTP